MAKKQEKKVERKEQKGEKDSKGITAKKAEDFSEWYTQVVQKAELADYAPIQGFMIIRPNAYAIWENIQNYFNGVLREKKVDNAYFPLLIPESFFKKEAEHAEGFAPELAYIEGKEEGERLALRPTSETIMYDSYAKWIRSWRDLPLMMNQWCNIIRWEVKQTKPFLRTREFLWQEGHCVFENEKGAEENMMEIIEEYRKIAEELLAIPVIVGKKSKSETFAGALRTMTIEALMPDGKALQCGTSHNLGQGVAKSFGISYLGKDAKQNTPWQTSWGFSTRLIGAMIMVHGDDRGLVIPPRIARNKVVIVPIYFEDSKEKVLKKVKEVGRELEKFGVIVDDREGYSPGWKFSEWEMKGIPIRIEIGPKDMEKKQAVLVRRDSGKKEVVSEKDVAKKVALELESMQKEMFSRAEKFLKLHITEAKSMTELKKKTEEGNIVKAYFADERGVEDEIKTITGGATSRIVETAKKEGVCVFSGKKTNSVGW
ncbi:MAG: proline--tRNA ligase, partial [Candidatus Nanoarchaeia archaeon]|nr:proline--tRNA ligase [Candidatus Nanoarchaeia archaeon]